MRRVLGESLAVGFVLFLSTAWAASEAPHQKGSPAVSSLHVQPIISPERVSVQERSVSLERAPKEIIRPVTVEEGGRLTLERLRRELTRYPDEDLLGRFLELSTELPPLFGEEG